PEQPQDPAPARFADPRRSALKRRLHAVERGPGANSEDVASAEAEQVHERDCRAMSVGGAIVGCALRVAGARRTGGRPCHADAANAAEVAGVGGIANSAHLVAARLARRNDGLAGVVVGAGARRAAHGHGEVLAARARGAERLTFLLGRIGRVGTVEAGPAV